MDNHNENYYTHIFEIIISNQGSLLSNLQNIEKTILSRRISCKVSNAYYYYFMNKISSFVFCDDIDFYLIDC